MTQDPSVGRDAPGETPAVTPHAPSRTPYRAPRLHSLGSAAAITRAVSMQGLMDGFKGNRTG